MAIGRKYLGSKKGSTIEGSIKKGEGAGPCQGIDRIKWK